MSGPTLGKLREDLRSGRVRVAELLDATFAAIAQSDADHPRLNAFLAVADGALAEEADSLDRALQAGNDVGPLAGVPVAVKDNICTSGMPTTAGSRILQAYISPYEATVVRRLRAAGALIVGKTNMDEFAMGSSTENSAFGPTRNPWDRERVPGGSSGGSSAAVAAGLVPAALGSDTGGSVRQPAAFCGVVGLKPTYGRVSRYGLIAYGSSLDQIGPLARTVEDTAVLLESIAGRDEYDSTSADVPVPEFTQGLARGVEGLVVGVAPEFFPENLDGRVADLCYAAIDRLQELGAQIRRLSLPHISYAIPAYYLLATAEASSNLARYDGVRYGLRAAGAKSTTAVYRLTRGSGFGSEVKRRVMLGAFGLSAGHHEAYYGGGRRVRRLITEDFERAFADGVNVIVAPTAPTIAFRLGEHVDDPLKMYSSDALTVPANLARLPAMSIPIGSVEGLPVGGQFVAPKFEESTMIGAASALERSILERPLIR